MNDTMKTIDASGRSARSSIWNLAILFLALVGAGGSLVLTLGLGLKACPLCFYQRTFAMAIVLAAGMLLWMDGLRSARVSTVSLPLATSGLGLALFHVYLVQSGKLECPSALFGWGDGPLQSLAIFVLLTVASIGEIAASRRDDTVRSSALVGVSLIAGLLTAWACIASSPPLPPPPVQAYDPVTQPLDMCRPPFRGA